MLINNKFTLLGVLALHGAAIYGLAQFALVKAKAEPVMLQPMVLAMGEKAAEPQVQPAPQPQARPKVKTPPVARVAPRKTPREVLRAQPDSTAPSQASLTVARSSEQAAEQPVAAGTAAPAAGQAGQATESRPQPESVAPSFHANYLNNPRPPYPPSSLALAEEGTVLLRVQVSREGEAADVALARSSGYPRLDAAALSTVKRWRFVPARLGNEAVAGTVLVPVNFSIKKA